MSDLEAKRDELCRKFGITHDDYRIISNLDEGNSATLSADGVCAEAWRSPLARNDEMDECWVDVYIKMPQTGTFEFVKTFYKYRPSLL